MPLKSVQFPSVVQCAGVTVSFDLSRSLIGSDTSRVYLASGSLVLSTPEGSVVRAETVGGVPSVEPRDWVFNAGCIDFDVLYKIHASSPYSHSTNVGFGPAKLPTESTIFPGTKVSRYLPASSSVLILILLGVCHFMWIDCACV